VRGAVLSDQGRETGRGHEALLPLRFRDLHERAHVLELLEGVERLGVRAGRREHVFEHPGYGDARPVYRVDQLAGGGVARGDEAVLGERLTGAHVGRRGEALLELKPRERLDQRRKGSGRDQPRLGIHDPHLDGTQAGLGTDVPPEEGGLGDRA